MTPYNYIKRATPYRTKYKMNVKKNHRIFLLHFLSQNLFLYLAILESNLKIY